MEATNTFIIGRYVAPDFASHTKPDLCRLERFFTWWGRQVALHPYPVILSCIVVTVLSSLGFLVFR